MIELKSGKTTYLGLAPDGRRRFAFDGPVGLATQMREPAGQWQDIDPSVEELDADGSTINFTKTPMLVKVGEDAKRRIYPDRTDLSYWIEFGKPFASMPKPTRKDGWFYWDFAHASIGIQVANTTVKFALKLKDSLAPTSITIPFSSQGLTRQGRFLYHDGRAVAILTKPFAVDANGVQRDVALTFQGGGVTLSLNTSGLVYPIVVDPTLDIQTAASLDDVDELESTGAIANLSYGVRTASSTNAAERYWMGNRWAAGIDIPLASTIDVAYWTGYLYADDYDNINANFHFEKAAAGAQFTTDAGSVTSKTRTTASASWIQNSVGGVTFVAGWYDSPSLVTPLQEVVDAYNVTAIVLIIRPNTDGAQKWFNVRPYDDTTSPANTWGPKLHIEYTEPVTFIPKIVGII